MLAGEGAPVRAASLGNEAPEGASEDPAWGVGGTGLVLPVEGTRRKTAMGAIPFERKTRQCDQFSCPSSNWIGPGLGKCSRGEQF